MTECEKRSGLGDKIKDGLSYISQVISASIFPTISDGAEMVMKNIEKRIIHLEKRIIRDISYLLVMAFGCILLLFALFSFLIEYLNWSRTASFFFVGIIIFMTGLLLKLSVSKR